ncbi:ABC transporter permease [Nocardioides sp. ChNu-153]|uniref:ABC transporter permease n=1 Tax=unclassified Nocardioides TaxID=2615069 RepID=UPI002405C808|nr:MULTISPECIES: ABC transporter permease [unclassified Nocardioides]MDF9716908.1 ABC transporter permease [Nocardioides sp. ChNu-99]MDN7122624.1 ABC transporter permease [Nocardioides sp. ChNu-153]
MTVETPPSGIPEERSENAIELKDVAGLSQGQIIRRRFLRHRGAMAGLAVIALIALLAITSIGVGPVPGWWKHAPSDQNPLVNPQGTPTMGLPTWLGGDGLAFGDAPFGQDELGRDIFARTMQGTQTSLLVMIVVGSVSALLGMAVGALAGFYRGATDQVLMRLTDLIITFPLIVIGAVLGKMVGAAGPFILAVVLGAVSWTTLARLVRAEFLSLREREFVDAARVAGASDFRIIVKHMIPNAMGVVIVNTTLLMAAAVILEASLSYLGFGIQTGTSLGKMISDYEQAFNTRPWLFWWPGLFVIALALSINFVGDGLRDAFDPRQKKIPSARKMARAAGRMARQDAKATS